MTAAEPHVLADVDGMSRHHLRTQEVDEPTHDRAPPRAVEEPCADVDLGIVRDRRRRMCRAVATMVVAVDVEHEEGSVAGQAVEVSGQLRVELIVDGERCFPGAVWERVRPHVQTPRVGGFEVHGALAGPVEIDFEAGPVHDEPGADLVDDQVGVWVLLAKPGLIVESDQVGDLGAQVVTSVNCGRDDRPRGEDPGERFSHGPNPDDAKACSAARS